jgi:hypothetical protein
MVQTDGAATTAHNEVEVSNPSERGGRCGQMETCGGHGAQSG